MKTKKYYVISAEYLLKEKNILRKPDYEAIFKELS